MKPSTRTRYYFFIEQLNSYALAVLVTILLFIVAVSKSGTKIPVPSLLAITITVILAPLLVIHYTLVRLQSNCQEYFITNMRIIIKRGIVSYRLESIPLSMVTDVVIRRNLLERIVGIKSLEMRGGLGRVKPPVLLGVSEAEETRQKLLELMQKKGE
ncbi:PH domain-containing protein [Candidatus Micrarchaeota archaeon]|nr:PH domain-containing protein [Candidatus Micrarchaeota archaeon]